MTPKIKVVLSVAVVIAIAGSYMFPQVQRIVERQIGSVSSPDIQSDYLTVNGLRTESRSLAFGVGTTTPCVVRAPIDATSTLAYASLSITNASSTATTWAVGKDIATTYANGEAATTTVLTQFPALASGAFGTMVASTSPSNTVAAAGGGAPGIDTRVTFAPGEYLVWSVAGLTHTGLSATEMGGICKAEFRVDTV